MGLVVIAADAAACIVLIYWLSSVFASFYKSFSVEMFLLWSLKMWSPLFSSSSPSPPPPSSPWWRPGVVALASSPRMNDRIPDVGRAEGVRVLLPRRLILLTISSQSFASTSAWWLLLFSRLSFGVQSSSLVGTPRRMSFPLLRVFLSSSSSEDWSRAVASSEPFLW